MLTLQDRRCAHETVDKRMGPKMNGWFCCSVAILYAVGLAVPAYSDDVLGNDIPNIDYDPNDGLLSVFTDGADVISLLIEGPRATSIDRWTEGSDADGVSGWTQGYFNGKEQWIGAGSALTGESVNAGTYQIATYATELGAADFGEVEIGTQSFGTLFTLVNVLGDFGNLPEDFNGDGEINFADFLQFSVAFGSVQPEHLVVFDLDTSGKVDFGDFLRFSNAFGRAAEVSAVPEPNGCVMAAFGLIAIFVIRTRRKNHFLPISRAARTHQTTKFQWRSE